MREKIKAKEDLRRIVDDLKERGKELSSPMVVLTSFMSDISVIWKKPNPLVISWLWG